ncbi:type III-A CRISPR-associated protein Csm2 [Phascolarctobacterium succinatutens]|uniref:type III-A CRISPR-associated protein Csm2 n=1 Tax=Phascolarctobacterium succinatutens TaxID=626940 RepID=UPI0026EF953D|nr:type III-A CRISPR-associated protein Csm2 [Phascolarctobacterium succinatutens]MBS5425955.1 type III-A CRISPR-associated protein Csm2 [Phascolarctobacterium succinatutens]
MMVNNMREQLVKAGYAQNSRPNMQKKVQQFDFDNFDVVTEAEKAIKGLQYKDRYDNTKIDVTTSQIRKFLTAVNVVRNKVDLYKAKNKGAESLSKELTADIKFLKVNLLYQAGRTDAVKQFMTVSKLNVIIDSIGDSLARFVKFTKYVEALVAYHKFLGGKDK